VPGSDLFSEYSRKIEKERYSESLEGALRTCIVLPLVTHDEPKKTRKPGDLLKIAGGFKQVENRSARSRYPGIRFALFAGQSHHPYTHYIPRSIQKKTLSYLFNGKRLKFYT
jgi:DNA-binding XRE family transcriptional regulator